MKTQHFSAGLVMGPSLHYIVKQFDTLIARRRQDIASKKPGAVIDDEFPYIVWVCMLKRPPGTISAVEANNVFALRGKFNYILEERLLDGSDETTPYHKHRYTYG